MLGRSFAAFAVSIALFACSGGTTHEDKDSTASHLDDSSEPAGGGGTCVCTTDASNMNNGDWYLDEESCQAQGKGPLSQGVATRIDASGLVSSCEDTSLRVFYLDARMHACLSTSIELKGCALQ